MKRLVMRTLGDECGQDLIEYALLASLISLIAIGAITSLGGGVKGLWDHIDAQVQTIPTSGS